MVEWVRAPDLKSGGPGFKSRSDHRATVLVNSQLVCLLPVGIFNHVNFNLYYFFMTFARPH